MSAWCRLQYIKKSQIDLPEQGSDEWLNNRLNQFGGSEIASVLGESPYQKPKELIDGKINKVYKDQPACSFGRIFEVVAVKYLRDILDYKIYNFSSIKSSKYPIAYSPDGIVYRESIEELTLLEIKCPYRRTKLQEIPKYYLPQIQTGLNILPVDYGEFIQFRFRLCSIWDLDDTPKYNRWLHSESRKRIPDVMPICYGYIEFPDEPFQDLGRCGPKDAIKLCKLPKVRRSMVHLNEYPRRPIKGMILGFKLLGYTNIKVDTDADYLSSREEQLWARYLDLLQSKEKADEEKQKV